MTADDFRERLCTTCSHVFSQTLINKWCPHRAWMIEKDMEWKKKCWTPLGCLETSQEREE